MNLLNNDIASVADLVEAYNAKLASLLNDYAPLRNKVDPIPAIVLEECLHDLIPVIARLVKRLLPPSKYQPYKEIYQSPYSRKTYARFHYFQTGLL